jgi:hypothetical protein
VVVDEALEEIAERKLGIGLPQDDTTAGAVRMLDGSQAVDVLLPRLGDSSLGEHKRRSEMARQLLERRRSRG